MASKPPAEIISHRANGSRLPDRREGGAPDLVSPFGMKKTGSHPSAIAAVISTFFSPNDAIQIGISLRTGCVKILRALPRPVP